MTTSPSRESPADAERVLDFRLVPAALLTWSVALVAACVGYQAAAGVTAVFGLLAAACVCVRPRVGSDVARVICVALLFAATASVAFGVRAYLAETHTLREAAAESKIVDVHLVLESDPRPITAARSGEQRFVFRASARAMRMDGRSEPWQPARAALTVFATGSRWGTVIPGESVIVSGKAAVPNRPDFSAATIFTTGPPNVKSQASWLQRHAAQVRSDFRAVVQSALPEEQAQLLPGLVIGDRSAMPQHMRDEFIATSLTHLTVVSGTHVTIVCGAVLLAARYATGSRRAAAAVTAVALVWFVIVCRPEPSVLRAAAMGSVTLLALISGRRRHALPALSAATIVLLLFRPQLATDLGFALSVTATAGIILATPPLADALTTRGMPRVPAAILAVAIVAQLVTAPLIAAFAGNFSVVGVLANLLAAPVVTAAIVAGYAGLVLAPLWSGAAAAAVFLAGVPVTWLLWVARYCARLPYAVVTVPDGPSGAVAMVALFALAGIAVRFRKLRLVLLASVVACCLALVPLRLLGPRFPPGPWVASACDVGQGDGFVLATNRRSAVVVDTGPEPALIDQCLRRLKITKVDLVILTHMHADHVAGISGVFRGRTVHAVGVGRGRDPASGYALVHAAAAEANVPLVELTQGMVLRFPSVTLTVLGPPTERAPFLGPNDQSLVVMAAVRTGDGNEFRVLFTGDAEIEAQQWLLDNVPPEKLAADIFTVPHHGAATSIAAFLRAVARRPGSVALIGVGAENSYGHPAPSIVALLEELGAIVARADVHGMVVVVVRDDGLEVAGQRAGKTERGGGAESPVHAGASLDVPVS